MIDRVCPFDCHQISQRDNSYCQMEMPQCDQKQIEHVFIENFSSWTQLQLDLRGNNVINFYILAKSKQSEI